MKVNEFIEKFSELKNDDDRNNFLNERLTTTYVDFERKIDMCNNIIKNTSYSEISEDAVIWNKRFAMEYFFYTVKLISTYTDIEIEDENLLKNFNSLNKMHIQADDNILSYIQVILSIIPITEINEFNFVLGLCKDDQESNERNLVSVISELIVVLKSVGNLSDAQINKLSDI